jgi:type I restriction enzyme S subunit
MKQYESQFRKLTDVGSVNRGKSKHRPRNAPELYGGPYPFVQTGEVKAANFFIADYTQTYSERGLAQSKLWQPGTLLITIAANIAETAVLKIPACFPDSIIGFIPRKGVSDVRFIKYCLDTYKRQMQSISQGTTQDNLSQGKLLSFRFRIPDYDQQQKIAAILWAYDDLIENNQRRIALLEKLAEEIYREWFVRLRFPGHEKAKLVKGIPQGWRVAELKELASVNPSSISRRDKPETILYVDISSVSTNRIEEVTTYSFAEAPGRARRRVQHGDVIWSSVRPANRAYCLIFNPPENMIVSTGFAVIRPKVTTPFSFLFFAVTSNPFVDQMTTVAKGAAYPATSFDDFEKAKLLVPSDDLLKEFHKKTEPMFRQKHHLQQQSDQLKQTRDKLLPRLISGKLPVENLDIQFPPGMAEEAGL